MNTQNLLLQANNINHISNLTLQSNGNVLKDGSSVFVKVLSDKGGGVYEGSVAGHRVHINSQKALEVGSSFVASITSKNGTIYITPKDGISNTNNQYIQINTIEGNQLAVLLQNLGVPVNQLSGNLLKMMMQLEMKIDGDVLRNLFVMASRHKGKEKAAGEILLLLKSKGIELSKEEIKALLGYIDGNVEANIEDYKKDNYKKEKEVINSINKKEEGWTIVPYNLTNIENNEVIGSGVIRILLSKYKDLKRINLSCYYNDKEYIFSLIFESKKCKEIKFNINPQEKSEEYYEKLLASFIKNTDASISFVDPSLIEGFSSEDEKIYSFEGEA